LDTGCGFQDEIKSIIANGEIGKTTVRQLGVHRLEEGVHVMGANAGFIGRGGRKFFFGGRILAKVSGWLRCSHYRVWPTSPEAGAHWVNTCANATTTWTTSARANHWWDGYGQNLSN
jgi:hypothetical protein